MGPVNAVYSIANTAGAKHTSTIDADFVTTGSVQAVFSDAAAAGTLIIEGSNDTPLSLAHDSTGLPIPVNWNTVMNGTVAASAVVASGATTTISMQWLNYRWLRITWTRTAGAGTIAASVQLQTGN